jgi:hypothetical protein
MKLDEDELAEHSIDIRALKEFSEHNFFKRAAIMVIAAHCSESEIADLARHFKSIDKDLNGTITFNEL